MGITKIKAGSIALLGDGFISLLEASSALGNTPLNLATQLTSQRASVFVQAKSWQGWAVEDIHDALEREQDEMDQVQFILDTARLGGLDASITFTGRLSLRFNEDGLKVLEEGTAFVCQFLEWSSRDRGFIIDALGQTVKVELLDVRKADMELLRKPPTVDSSRAGSDCFRLSAFYRLKGRRCGREHQRSFPIP